MKKIFIGIIGIIAIITIIATSIFSYRNNSLKEKYMEAIQFAENKDFVTAKKLFSELPPDFQYEKKEFNKLTVSDWIEDIDKHCDSPFVGEWCARNNQGIWELKIYISVLDFRGIDIAYSRSYTSPGGVHIGDFGKLYVYDDGITAEYTDTNKSNAKHYKLVLTTPNTIDVYFQNDLEVTLHKQ